MHPRPILVLPLLLATLAGCREAVLTARPEAEANAALAVLIDSGLDARKRPAGRSGFDVTVAKDELEPALGALTEAGLPRTEAPGLAELFGEPGLVPSGVEEQVRYHRALSGELARSLGALDGVREARVHLAVPVQSDRRLGGARPAVPKAGVLLHAKPGQAVRLQLQEDQIRLLVAGAVAGLDPQAVTVMVAETSARRPPPAASGPRTQARWGLVLGGGFTMLTGVALSAVVLVRRRRSDGGAP